MAFGRDFDTYRDDFRRDYDTRYGTSGRTWNDYEPAYRYGCELAGDERYRGRSWDEFEPEAQRDWQDRFQEGWDDFKDAVRHAWESVTGKGEHRRAA